MVEMLKFLRALADPTRMRIMSLLIGEELSVHELQAITQLGQSRISTHLGLLLESGLLESRRDGKRSFYKMSDGLGEEPRQLVDIAIRGGQRTPEQESDQANLKRVLDLRRRPADLHFSQVAGRFDRSYGPGRSWQAFGHLLLRMLPPLTIADLGSGEGLLSELIAKRARRVIAVDNSEKIVAYGKQAARQHDVRNLEFRLGDLEDPPIAAGSMDAVILSQALHHAEDPKRALAAAARILKAGGQVLILDLVQHAYKEARELYGDRWLGFSPGELQIWLENAGFVHVETTVVSREEAPPHFQTLLACASKAKRRRKNRP